MGGLLCRVLTGSQVGMGCKQDVAVPAGGYHCHPSGGRGQSSHESLKESNLDVLEPYRIRLANKMSEVGHGSAAF